MVKSEEQLHLQICKYLRLQYPKVRFNSDMAGVKLKPYHSKKARELRSSNGFPDLFICKTIVKKDIVICGLFLEIKKKTPFKKNGELFKNEHLQEKNEWHEKLRAEGYEVYFVWTFNDAKKLIDNYIKLCL